MPPGQTRSRPPQTPTPRRRLVQHPCPWPSGASRMTSWPAACRSSMTPRPRAIWCKTPTRRLRCSSRGSLLLPVRALRWCPWSCPLPSRWPPARPACLTTRFSGACTRPPSRRCARLPPRPGTALPGTIARPRHPARPRRVGRPARPCPTALPVQHPARRPASRHCRPCPSKTGACPPLMWRQCDCRALAAMARTRRAASCAWPRLRAPDFYTETGVPVVWGWQGCWRWRAS